MLLSICIPTYNRAAFIGTTLDSIASQLAEDLEVVVSDNASTDNTAEIVESFRARIPRLVYSRGERNVGADRNYLRVIEHASGDFCWFMGSDDIVEPGAVAALSDALRRFPQLTGVSVNRFGYSFDLSRRLFERAVADGRFLDDHLFTGIEETAIHLGDYFGYLPGQVVNRALWNATVSESDLAPFCNAYVHVYVILRMLQKQPRWLYLTRRCAGWRSGNDSFLSAGLYRRLEIDVVGYRQIAREIFGERSRVYRVWINKIISVHVMGVLRFAKVNRPAGFSFSQVLWLCLANFYNLRAFWTRALPVIVLPRAVLTRLERLKRIVFRIGNGGLHAAIALLRHPRNVRRLQRLRGQHSSANRELLLVGLIEHVGDIVAAEPISRYLREECPDALLVWAVRPEYAELVAHNPAIDTHQIVGCVTEWLLLRRTRIADRVVDLHLDGKACPRCLFPVRKPQVGVSTDNYFNKGNLLEVFCQSGGLPRIASKPRLHIPSLAATRIDALKLPAEFIAIHANSNIPEKNWTGAKWSELATQIRSERSLKVVEVGTTAALQGVQDCIDLCGQLSLLETAEVIRRARLFIGIDSGPSHIANAVGTPGVILLGQFLLFDYYNPFSGEYSSGQNATLVHGTYAPAASLRVNDVFKAVEERLERYPDLEHA